MVTGGGENETSLLLKMCWNISALSPSLPHLKACDFKKKKEIILLLHIAFWNWSDSNFFFFWGVMGKKMLSSGKVRAHFYTSSAQKRSLQSCKTKPREGLTAIHLLSQWKPDPQRDLLCRQDHLDRSSVIYQGHPEHEGWKTPSSISCFMLLPPIRIHISESRNMPCTPSKGCLTFHLCGIPSNAH